MQENAKSSPFAGWQGSVLIAITYVYFLIFAQFAFLNRIKQLGLTSAHLSTVMAWMAAAGITSSLLNLRLPPALLPARRLQIAFLICSTAAIASVFPLGLAASCLVSLLIGAGLGMLTVTLVAHIRQWTGDRNGLPRIGFGTGLGYFACNIPLFFTASPKTQASIAAALCLAGIPLAIKVSHSSDQEPAKKQAASSPFWAVLVSFTALIWLDSAAFFIIQNTSSLKAGTWQGSIHLWANGVSHFAAAVISASLLRRRGTRSVLILAALVLGIACLVLRPNIEAASLLYPIGVSFYSVALVAYPSLLAPAVSEHERTRRAGYLYAIAGWAGSAMGIGMGQNLHTVPPFFVLLVLCVIGGTILSSNLRRHRLAVLSISSALVLALGIYAFLRSALPGETPLSSPIERGRRVYISEGCIHCHSQYVRPQTRDALLWGPAESIEQLRTQQPPLIGNRRQGPDISQVGSRRSSLWLRAHLMYPSELSRGSIMPSYAYLFQGSTRGEDLISYLQSLHSNSFAEHTILQQTWTPSQDSFNRATPEEGSLLYAKYCATCHEQDGITKRRWATSFRQPPPVFPGHQLQHSSDAAISPRRVFVLSRIVKFGIPGTDMPGHEYFSDQQIASLAVWLDQIMASTPSATNPLSQGENR